MKNQKEETVRQFGQGESGQKGGVAIEKRYIF